MTTRDTPQLSDFARETIERLGLSPHPEGGWYRRTWQSGLVMDAAAHKVATGSADEYSAGPRPLASVIYFLLPAGDTSAWHEVDADEVWLWHGPGAVTLEIAGSGASPDEGSAERIVLGAGITADAPGPVCAQCVIKGGSWQRTLPASEDALVSCVVSPGFTYEGFSLARD